MGISPKTNSMELALYMETSLLRRVIFILQLNTFYIIRYFISRTIHTL